MKAKKAESGVQRTGQRNRNEKFSIMAILMGTAIIVIGWQITVQVFGFAFNYHPALGEGLAAIGQHRLYVPLIWTVWSYEWASSGSPMTRAILMLHIGAVLSAVAGLALCYFLYYKRSLKSEKVDDIHGSARFADDDDVRSMKLVPLNGGEAKGVIVGAYKFENGDIQFLRYNEAAHILGAAPSRSGKGVVLVLPTLLTYPNSTFVNDIKGENFELSSGFRHKAESLCIRLDPTHVPSKSIDGHSVGLNTARWNVLKEIRIFTVYDVMDSMNIAAELADPDSKGMDDHWVSTSYELLTGVQLHVVYAERDKSLAGCASFMADPSFDSPEQMFERMMQTEHDPELRMGWKDTDGRPTKTHPVVAKAAKAMLNKEEKERNSVLSTAKTRLALYMEPIVGHNTSDSDFAISDLMNHNKPVSFYLTVPPSDKERLRPYVRLFIGFFLRSSTNSMRFEDGAGAANYLHRLLLLVDELPALRKLDSLQDGLAFIAGYGITAFLLVQDIPQLTSRENGYGENESIRSGCHVQIYFTPNTTPTAKAISEKLGQRTVEKQRVNYSGRRFSATLDSLSVSVEDVKRSLMDPDEVERMPPNKALVFVAGKPPILAEKVPYYTVPELKRRASLPAPMRVGISWRQSDRPGAWMEHNWMMLSADRDEGYLWVAINVYRDYPAVSATLKQLKLGSTEVIEVEAQLCDDRGNPWNGELSEERTDYQVRWDAQNDFDPQEAFELHLNVVEAQDKLEFEQMGFFTTCSVYEREARAETRELARAEEAKTGTEVKERFIPIKLDMVCLGDIFHVTDRCVIMRGREDAFYVHRKEVLDVVPKVGQRVLVRYKAGRGSVESRA